jgi:hypothetical protein
MSSGNVVCHLPSLLWIGAGCSVRIHETAVTDSYKQLSAYCYELQQSNKFKDAGSNRRQPSSLRKLCQQCSLMAAEYCVHICIDYLLCFKVLHPHHDLALDALQISAIAIYGKMRTHNYNTYQPQEVSVVLLQ